MPLRMANQNKIDDVEMNNDNKIGLMSVADLSGKKFIIPEYQRGYRWEQQQVTDLLKDLEAFMEGGGSGYYCLQPLAVKRVAPDMDKFREDIENTLQGENDTVVERMSSLLADSISWEVIDGQQRLTTIYILIKLLCSEDWEPYNISYKTREGSEEFLKNIRNKSEEDAQVNIDYSHMKAAYDAANNWLDHSGNDNLRTELLDVINNRVKFIWYESVNEKPISVFTRLNIGRISLTNAELIKATLLNKSNYPKESGLSFYEVQLSISSKWDEIEYALQNEEFWLFLNSTSYNKPTRIDFIFEIIHSQDLYGLKSALNNSYNELIGNDRYSVFRYFTVATEHYHSDKTIAERLNDIWSVVVSMYNTFTEWYNDKLYYHYVGFLLWDREERKGDKYSLLKELYKKWETSDKEEFRNYIISLIKKAVNNTKASELNNLHFDNDKPTIKRILLLHNIQTVIENQEIQRDKYELNVFYKFPFHLFKKEVWNVEHIDSATTNELTNTKEKKAWARVALYAIEEYKDTEDLKQNLSVMLKNSIECHNFDDVFQRVAELFPNDDKLIVPEGEDADTDNERMHPWNLTLLDEGTNKAYKNSIFSVKRSFIIFKEMGKHCTLKEDGTVDTDAAKAIAFVPPCTKQVFMKYYTTNPTNLLSWGRTDASLYLQDMENKVKLFLTDEK